MKYKKLKIKTEDHQTLWVTYEEWCSGGDIVEGEEDNEFPEREDENIDWHLLNVSLSEPSNLYRDPVKVKCSKLVRVR